MLYPVYCIHRYFHIYPHPFIPAHDSSRIVTTMRNGKMILLARKEWLAGVCYPYKVIREIGKQELKEKPARQVLQPLVRMGHITMLRHISFEEFFRFFDLPDAQSRGFVDLLLKKNRHYSNLDHGFQLTHFRFAAAIQTVKIAR
jgi:hypothetical protein